MANPARSRSEQYSGKVTPVGNSKGIRIDAAFFKAHPEFNGAVKATVLADGQVLLSASRATRRQPEEDNSDPVMLVFLSFLEQQLSQHPELIAPVDQEQLARIGQLVEGVEPDDTSH
ncbi:MAG: type II toxin-antitoxin system PrlF family antitoxin [Burkholderiales bacterium]|jgi:hypothetical protein|nr:type II toxin-antitoxin system PrlF family antitoxin [Burkholderiales bacterium]MCA3162102.1 type II toxin-antitoxin system PrlF family antitoxin [Burkholderiales bacterium]MCA3163791.1 type II toxin-antitoxin system PrlF family antitoxin [Burkholderiales bacterium]MCA3165649.1 type II toxin-antitoxin system PrlF family antitoxin [Burkholderiales bacterium]MCA3169881.1 type II toxin-antitoxin system PrlF family antitoxin [Burkholderiales bacterium]